MVEITNRKILKQWLDTRPVEDARIIAARAALRVLPGLASLFLAKNIDDPFALILPVFRANAVASTVGKWPVQQQGLKQAASAADSALSAALSAVSSAADSVADSALYASSSASFAASSAVAGAANSVADSVADSALYAAASASSSFAASFAAAAWKAVEQDTNRLEAGTEHGDLADQPIWPEGPPQGAAEAWPTLREALLSEDPLWHVWTDWYQDRLDGKPMIEALEVEKALIPDEDWEKGPTHVNAIIAGMIARHARSATPQGETLQVSPASGLIQTNPSPAKAGTAHENACEKVSDRLDDLRERLTENQFTALQPSVKILDRVVEKYTDRPRRIHDDFESEAVEIRTLVEKREVSDDAVVTGLLRDLENSVLDLRNAYPELQEAVEARQRLRAEQLSPEEYEALRDVARVASEMTEGELPEELQHDADLLAEPDAIPAGDTVPDGPRKNAIYRLGGRLLRIGQLIPTSEKLTEIYQRSVKHLDHVDKVGKGIAWYGVVGWAILRALGFM